MVSKKSKAAVTGKPRGTPGKRSASAPASKAASNKTPKKVTSAKKIAKATKKSAAVTKKPVPKKAAPTGKVVRFVD